MVAVVTGSGLGLGTSSLATLGGGGTLGNAGNGRGGDRVYVNASTGNLVIQRSDDFLLVPGRTDFAFFNTYNSQGLLANSFDNQDTWQFAAYKRVKNLTGTVNTAGSTLTRVDGDGVEVVYAYDTARTRYISTDGAGAHDSLSYNTSNSRWTWAEDSGEVTETYYSLSSTTGTQPAGRIFEQRDPNGQLLTYTYNSSGRLTAINNVGTGESLALIYVSGTSNVQEVRGSVRAADGTLQTVTRVRYTYLGDRLESIRTDLTPNDNAVVDGAVYTTTFAYNANGLVSSIAQTDGSSVSFTYVNVASAWRVQTVTVNDGTSSRVTTFSYNTSTRVTTVTDPLGSVTTMEYDTANRFVRLRAPDADGVVQEVLYGYDTAGNVTSITDGRGQVVTMQYDTRGNLTLQRDAQGNTRTRIYNTGSGTERARNLLLSETSYTTPDPDGAGAGTASGPLVTRYVYDGSNNLRFVVTHEGRVTEHLHSGTDPDVTLNTGRLRVATLEYQETRYTVPASATATIALSSMNTWRAAAGTNRSAVLRTDYAYETGSSRLSRVTRYSSADAGGNGVVDGSEALQQLIYDAAGNLLQTVDANGHTTLNTFDGLGRLLTTTRRASGQSSGGTAVAVNQYNDAAAQIVTTSANGLVSTSVFNRAGELLSVVRTGPSAQALGTISFAHDANGRLRMVTDPTGVREHRLYDIRGRAVAAVDGDGTLTEYVYDKNDHVIKTIVYAVRVNPASLVDGSGNPANPTLASLRTVANADPTRNRLTRTVYDNAGRLVFGIDEEGALTEMRYDGAMRITDTVRYANRISIAAATDEVLVPAVTALIVASVDDRRTRHFYDLEGNLLGTLDAEGFLTEQIYDGAGQLAQAIAYANPTPVAQRANGTLAQLRPATDAARDIKTWTFYDGQGRPTGSLDAEGYLTEIVYDRNGNALQTIRYPSVRSYTGTPTLAGVRPASTAGAQITTAAYDEFNRVVQQTDHEGTVTTLQYDAVGNLVSSTRALGTLEARTAEARYDFLGRVIAELSAEGRALITGGMTQPQIDAIWAQWAVTHSYDTAGRRVSSTDPNGNRSVFYYDADGRLTHVVNALGEVTESRYNALNQVAEQIGYFNRIASASVPGLTGGLASGALTALIVVDSSRDTRTTLSYATTGRVASATTAEGGSITSTYNAFGEEATRIEQVDASRVLEHRYSYNVRGLLTQTRWDPTGLNTIESNEYDAFGRLTRVTDPRGNVGTVEYDRLGRQIATVDALTLRRTSAYDAFSRVLTTTDALNNTTTYAYSDSTRSVTVTTPESITLSTARNRHGQTASVTDGRGNTTAYAYDRNGNLISTSDGLGSLESRTYDRAGRVVTATDARGIIATIAYDAANRVFTRTVDTAGGGLALQTRYVYDARGRVIESYDPTNALTTMEYDRDGRVTAVTVDPSGTARSRTTYSYDRAGNVITVTEGAGSTNPRVTQYQYDVLGRRTQEVVDPGAGKLNLTTGYRYDANGNLTRRIDANGFSTWYVYDGNDRPRFTVDALGGVTETGYDAESRTVSVRRYALPVSVGSFGDVVTTGQVTPTINAADRLSQTAYDRDGREVYAIDAQGGVTRRELDANGNAIRQTTYSERIPVTGYATAAAVQSALGTASDGNAANDVEVRAVYDARNRAAFQIDGLGGVVGFEYDAAGNAIASTAFATLRPQSGIPDLATMQSWASSNASAARDQTNRMWYDAAGRVAFALDAEGYLKELQYDAAGRPRIDIVYAAKPSVGAGATLAQVRAAATAVANASNDQRTTTNHDAGGRVIQLIDALGIAESYGYDAVGNRTSYTNRKGSTWTYEYDANGRLVFERSPLVAVTTVSESGGALTSATNSSLSLVTYVEYDALGNVRRRTEAHGTSQARTTEYQYDALGRQTRTTFPPVGVYDAPAGDELRAGAAVVRVETTTTLFTETAYDTLGNAFRNRDVAGNYSYKVYDALGRVLYEVDAENYATSYSYDTFGNPTQLTRHANRLSSALPTASASVSTGDVTSRLTLSASQDRLITTEYDRLGRATRVIRPSAFNFAPTAGAAGGQTFTAGATTINEYDAFGQVVRQRELVNPLSSNYADTHIYYDRRGAKTAVVDPLGYLVTFEYDETGDLVRQVEYSRALAPGWTTTSYGTAVVTTPTGSPDHAAGYDREVRVAYDRLNRKTSETRYNVEYTTISGTTTTRAVGNQTTTYGYDAVGNLTRATDHAGASTYTYYDVLGRTVAIAEPSRDRGNGAALIPLVVMRRDAFGNLVEETRYANGASSASETAFVAGTAVAGPQGDRKTLMRLDSHGHALQLQDPAGAQRHASYNMRGEVAKEWQPVVDADGTLETLVTIRQHDKLGHEIAMVEPQRLGGTTIVVTTQSEYNGFGEITRRGTNGGWQESFEYDQAGRLWRGNGGDGVTKVYLYDLAGNATAEIRSKERDLKSAAYADAASVAALTTQRMRTETRFDLRGSIVEQRLPAFGVTSGLEPIGASFQIGSVAGPNNPAAIYQRIDLGMFGGVVYHVNPSATLAEGGGYYLNPNGTYTQDPTHQVVSATRIHWAAPSTAGVNAYFEYRVQGSGGSWTSIPVSPLVNNELGVNVSGLANPNNTVFEYRITYSRPPENLVFAEATGTFRVDGNTTATLSVNPTAPDPAAEIATLATTHSNGLVSWQAPTDTSVTAVLRLKLTSSGTWTDYTAARVGSNFQITPGLLNTAGTYDYEIVHSRAGTVIAKKAGQLTSNGSGSIRNASGTISETAIVTSVDSVATPTGQVNGLVGATVASSEIPSLGPPGSNVTWPGQNVVNLSWASVGAGQVRVELDYVTQEWETWYWNAQDVAWDTQWYAPLTVNNRQFTFASGATGASLVWDTATGAGGGGITQINAVRVYKETSPGVWTLQYSQSNPTPVYGRALNWARPSSASVVASFEIKAQGAGTWSTLTINALPALYGVDLNPFAPGGYDYRITYRIGNRVTAQQTGVLTITNASSTTTTTATVTAGSPPAAPETVATVVGQAGSTVSATITSSQQQTINWGSHTAPWSGSNAVNASWTDVGAVPIKVELDYVTRNRSYFVYIPQDISWELYEDPGITVNAKSFTFASAATGTTLSWTDTGTFRGIAQINAIRVYTTDAQGNYTVLLRSSTAPTPPSLVWSAPAASTTVTFGYRTAGSGAAWTYRTATRAGSNMVLDLAGIASGSYEYYIGYRRSGETFDASGATGAFTISGGSVSASGQTPFNNAPGWISGVTHSGNSVVWSQAPVGGASVTFEYWNGSGWVALTASTSNGTAYSASVVGVPNGTYSYRIKYTASGQSLPYLQATGTFTANTSTTSIPASVAVTPQSNQTWPTVRIQPISLSADRISWNHAAVAGSTVQVQYSIGGVGTYTKTPDGSSPSYSIAFSEAPAGTRTVWYDIYYFMPGETDPYARASGTVTLTVTYTNVPPTITVTSQAAVYPSGVQQIAAPTDNGNNLLGWTTAAEAGATVTFSYWGAGGTPLTLATTPNGSGYRVNVSPLPPGAFNYEITYVRSGQSNPYARAVGTFTITRTTTVSNAVLTDTTQTTQTPVTVAPVLTQTMDRWGNALSVTDATSATTHYRYDQFNQLREVKLPQLSVTSTTGSIVTQSLRPANTNYFDLLGRVIATRDANGNLNKVTLNAAGQITVETHADNGQRRFTYDAFGNQIEITNELSFRTRNAINGANLLTAVSREVVANGFGTAGPNDIVVDSYGYDASGRRITETNGENETTKYYYDLHGNVRRRHSPLGRNTDYEYDAQGKKTRETNALGAFATWNYDHFGRLSAHADLGGWSTTFTYDLAGLALTQNGSAGQRLTFTTDEAGHVTRIDDVANATQAAAAGLATTNRTAQIGYDIAGRRGREKTVIDGRTHQDLRIEYDAAGRTSKLTDLRYTLTYTYDAQGNRTHTVSTYFDHQQVQRTQDLWYSYDAMNRVLVSQGVNASNVVDINTTQGVRLTYDVGGQRTSATTYGNQLIVYEDIETWNAGYGEWISNPRWLLGTGYYTDGYSYDGLGRLKQMTRSGEERTSYAGHPVQTNPTTHIVGQHLYDKASRENQDITTTLESQALVERTRTSVYTDDGALQTQTTRKGPTQTESIVTYNNDAASILRGYTVQVYNTGASNSLRYTSTYTNNYRLAETYLETGQSVTSSGSGAPQNGSTSRAYNVNGELVSFSDSRDANKNRYFANAASGQPLTVVQGNYASAAAQATAFQNALARRDNSVKAQHFFFANGQNVGSFGQLQEAGVFKANFDVNYTPVSDTYPSAVPPEVVVQSGDTLRTIAARVFGDASLWYILAEENGLSNPDEMLTEGTLLRVPNEVIALGNSATSFKPFDINQALGDTTPTQPMPPPPKKKGCGVIGMILVIVVAIVVTVLTAGAAAPGAVSAIAATGTTGIGAVFSAGVAVLTGSAATTIGIGATIASAMVGGAVGSIVSQGVGIAVGVQDKFSWSQVAVGAIGAGVTAGLGGASALATAGRTGAAASVGKFLNSFSNLGPVGQLAARAAVSNALTQGIAVATGLQSSFSWRDVAISAVAAPVADFVGSEVGEFVGSQFVGDIAKGLTGSAVRAAFGGKVDVATIIADAFGNALGNSLVDTLSKPSLPPAAEPVPAEEWASPMEEGDGIVLISTDADTMISEQDAEALARLSDHAAGLRELAAALADPVERRRLLDEYYDQGLESVLGSYRGDQPLYGLLGRLFRVEPDVDSIIRDLQYQAGMTDAFHSALHDRLAEGVVLQGHERALLTGDISGLTFRQAGVAIDGMLRLGLVNHNEAFTLLRQANSFLDFAAGASPAVNLYELIQVGSAAIISGYAALRQLDRKASELVDLVRSYRLSNPGLNFDDPFAIPGARQVLSESVALALRAERSLLTFAQRGLLGRMRWAARLIPQSVIRRWNGQQSRQLGMMGEFAVDLVLAPLVDPSGTRLFREMTDRFKIPGSDNGIDRSLRTNGGHWIDLEIKVSGTARWPRFAGDQALGARIFVPGRLAEVGRSPSVSLADRTAALARLADIASGDSIPRGYAIVARHAYTGRPIEVQVRDWDRNVGHSTARRTRGGRI